MSKLVVQSIEGPDDNANRFNDGLTVTSGVSTFVGIVSCNTALLVLGGGGTNNTGIEARANSTQGTDTNKAIRVRNNSATNTFEVSYKGRVDAESFHGDGSNLTGISTAAVPGISTQLHSNFGTLKTSGISTIGATTDSGSTTTGSLIISGGVGIAKSSYLGNNVNFADGKGLDFAPIAAGGWGAVAGAATTTTNVLDCYEEGTWVPILYGTDTAGSFSASVNNGYYTRVGRMVCASFYIQGGALSSSSGNWLVKGFPFNWNANISEGGYVWYQGSIGAVSAGELAMPLGLNSQAVMRFFEIPTGGGSVASLSGDHSGITVGVTSMYQTN